jgi:3'-phosphoadenosine 5'-phosphosulfate sulfotransferase (PAPS reductase)/FAD synthetase
MQCGESMTINYGSGFNAPWLNPKINRSLHCIEQWLDKCDRQVYASISGGKDSLVMAHLIRQVYPNCPFVWVNQGHLAEWDDCVELLQLLKSEGWNIVEVCPVRDLWHLYLDYGIPLEGKMDTKADKIINQKLMYDPLDEYQEINNIKGYAWGIRKRESRNRAMYLKKYGEIHQLISGLWCCSPVAFWTTQDIWLYIDSQELPYPAMYDRDRMNIRNGPPIGTTGVNWGRLAELRYHNPQIWQEFVTKFPQLRNYA